METIKFTGQLHSIRLGKDGGGKMTIEFGADSLAEVQRLMGLGDSNLAFAAVPYVESKFNKQDIDPHTGEIII